MNMKRGSTQTFLCAPQKYISAKFAPKKLIHIIYIANSNTKSLMLFARFVKSVCHAFFSAIFKRLFDDSQGGVTLLSFIYSFTYITVLLKFNS